MKAAIVGTGRMGQAAAWALGQLGYELILADRDEDNLKKCLASSGNATVLVCVNTKKNVDYAFLNEVDIVVSALPYHQNLSLAHHCIVHNIKYCDLGGNVNVSKNINDYAVDKGSTVMTDLGLAPGWVNILAEKGFTDSPTHDTVEMMVGGLPICPTNYLKYTCTWSHDGLINEYKDDCFVLRDGNRVKLPGMSELVRVDTMLGKMEAFCTSGGIAHTIDVMKEKGVNNCCYKTIRYVGHCVAIRFLINECELSNEDLINIFKKSCPPVDDLIIIKVKVDGWKKEKILRCNDKFSAMQIATAFPLVSAADAIAQDAEIQGVLTYEDIPYDKFNKTLDFLFEEAKK